MFRKISIAAGIAGLILGPLSLAAETEVADENVEVSFTDAILGGSPHLNFRYRYEYVSDDLFTKNANASTLRFRLNYGTGKWRGWSGFGEFDYVGEVFVNDFNSGAGTSPPDRNIYPVVADPKGADLNQFFLDYEGFADTRLRFGRQRILLDNQRFVGGVGWRQNEQTYDGWSAKFNGFSNVEIFYSYIDQVNRIFGERTAAGTQNVNTHLLNVPIKIGAKWKITPYYYYLKNDDSAAWAATSTATAGARANGEIAIGSSSLKLVGEVATQSDIGDNPVNYDAQYFHLVGVWALQGGLSFGLGFESLGGDELVAGSQFRTPLATLHKFQGWADQLLATPAAGVDDIYASAKYKFRKWNFQAIYHDFSAAEGSADWGNELDLAASRSLGDRYSLLLKAAFFDSADPIGTAATAHDVTKIWVQLVAKY